MSRVEGNQEGGEGFQGNFAENVIFESTLMEVR